MKGVITKFDGGRKFGFIRLSDKSKDDIFFHLSDVKEGEAHLSAGAEVSFEKAEGTKGPKAINIRVTRGHVSPYRFFSGAAVFLTVALCFGAAQLLPSASPLLCYLVAINIALFMLMGLDKSSAAGTATRVPERVLLAFAAVGGSLGLLLSMRFFRHKIRKAQFQFGIAMILALQVIIVHFLFPELRFR